jgi:hypothetical protein
MQVDKAEKKRGADGCTDLLRTQDGKKREETLAQIQDETNPQKIIELAKAHCKSPVLHTQEELKDIRYELLAALHNSKTPTTFLIWLCHYPKFHPSEMIDPYMPKMSASFVTSEIREAAIKALASREWKFGDLEKAELSQDEVDVYKKILESDKVKYKINNIKPPQTPLGELSKEIIDFIKRGEFSDF